MNTYALLLNHAPDRYDGLTEDDYMDIIKDYVAWVEKLSAEGTYVGGEKLADGPGKTLTKTDTGIEVHDAPMAELAEVLGGFMLIKAADYASAVAIAKTCPHMVHNSTLEIREVQPTD
ncbi:YciI family protein [Kordiimonas aquimaris]|uniref:YciI family protein n=1 Tax=Kordiimonas aquimaris TaxID=707591 RepID=UPI0021D040E8|nr:YciI family protein [Kordiimonas aquimaris]